VTQVFNRFKDDQSKSAGQFLFVRIVRIPGICIWWHDTLSPWRHWSQTWQVSSLENRPEPLMFIGVENDTCTPFLLRSSTLTNPPMDTRMHFLLLITLFFSPSATAVAQQGRTRAQAIAQKYPALPDSVQRRSVTIWSDGTKMAGDLYLPADLNADAKLPVIVFVAGTGGTKKGTPARMSPLFVAKGFAFLAFDYRGWGESDSKLQMLEPMPEPDENGEITVKARAIRWQMDFADQVTDIHNAIAFVAGEPNVDADRIGILGTSYGGGLATWIAATDARVHCVAVQVPGMGGGRAPAAERRAFNLQSQQARGEAEPVPFETGVPGGKMSRYAHMRYNTTKSIGYSAMEAAEKITIPMLIIDAENEELMDRTKNGQRVAEILEANGTPVKYQVLEGITHYGVYSTKFAEATALEIDWFDQYLSRSVPTTLNSKQ
jgi:acetyl esterase/lipase